MAEPSKSKKYHYSYLILNITNGMKYVGARSCACLPKLDTKYWGTSKTLNKAMREEGQEHFIKIILVEFPSRRLALMHEVELHSKFDVGKNSLFYNKAKQTSEKFEYVVSGPNSPNYGVPKSPEAKAKMSVAKKGKKGRKLSEEEKEKLLQSAREANLGRKASEETKQKQSKAHKGKYTGKDSYMYGKHLSDETKKLIGNSSRGRIKTDETRKAISTGLAKNNKQKGKTLSKDHRANIGKSLKNRIVYIYITPVGEFTSASEAGRVLQCNKTTIIRRCKNEFAGYSLRLVKDRKEEFKKLYEQGLTLATISKLMEIPPPTLSTWKRVMGLSRPTIDPSWQKNYCM